MVSKNIYVLGVSVLVLALTKMCVTQNEKDPLKKVKWWEVHRYFTSVANNGLLTRFLQEKLNEDFVWSEEEANLVTLLAERQKSVDTLFKQITQSGQKIRRAIQDTFHMFNETEAKFHCCDGIKERSLDEGCFMRQGRSRGLAANPPAKVLQTMHDILSVYPSMPLFYFSFLDGSTYFYPASFEITSSDQERCHDYHSHVRSWYKVARTPVARDIVMFLDLDDTLDSDVRNLMIEVASQVEDSLTQDDRVYKFERLGTDGAWQAGTARNLRKTISDLKQTPPPSVEGTPARPLSAEERVRAAKDAFESLYSAYTINILRKTEKVVVQLVAGPSPPCLHPGLWAAENVSEPTIITYVFGLESESQCSNMSSDHHVVHIRNRQDLNNTSKAFMNFFLWSKYLTKKEFPRVGLDDDVRIALPYRSYFTRRLILTLSLPIVINGTFVGVVGCDMSKLTNLQYVTNFGDIQDSYGFLVDLNGRAVSHPLLPKPQCTRYDDDRIVCSEPNYESVNRLEQHENVQDILKSMVHMGNGSKIIEGDYIQSTGHSTNNQGKSVIVKKIKLAYAWVPLTSIKLSFCIVIPVHNNKIYKTTYKCTNGNKCRNPSFNYYLNHDPDDSDFCSYYGKKVEKNKGLIKFAATVFEDPIHYNHMLASDPILHAIQEGQSPYSLLKGSSLPASVVMAKTAVGLWREQPSLACHISVRFFGTSDGVFITYPGVTHLKPNYDHRARHWYEVAVANVAEHPTVSLTTPYQDAMGGGEILTVATPVQRALPSGTTMLVGVAGADFSVRFLTHQLRGRLRECDGETIACFLIDVMGYIVLDLKQETLARFHIAEAYPAISKYLTKSELLVRKGCYDYEKGTVFLYWTFQMPDGVTSFFSDNKDASLAIYKIPYMNVFLVARLTSVETRKKLEHSSVCLSTCSKSVEPPCTVESVTGCQHPEENMRKSFLKMPLCFLNSADVKLNVEPKTCEVESSENMCHNASQSTICRLWSQKC